MALEQVFDCPRTLRRLRTGPLGKLLEGFGHWLLDGGFTRGCIRTHLSNVSHLNQYLGRGMARLRATVAANDIEGFFKAYPSQCRNQGPLEGHLRRVRHSINRFTEYLGQKGLFDPLDRAVPILRAYKLSTVPRALLLHTYGVRGGQVRAGVVNHPSEWKFSGFNEIQKPRRRYSLIDYKSLTEAQSTYGDDSVNIDLVTENTFLWDIA